MRKLHSFILLIVSMLFIVFLTSCGEQPDKSLDFKGISFNYPSYWKGETEELDGSHFFIKCEERFDKETIFFVSFYTEDVDPEVLLDSYFGNIEELELTKEKREKGKYGRYDCIGNKYQLSKYISKFYGEAYAFKAGDKSILIIKQSEKEFDLEHDKYKAIENSFTVSNDEVSVGDVVES